MTDFNLNNHRLIKGFTLFEVMVALIVCGVGLLGLAKMAALGISASQNAGARSLIAVQMESLASMMHANSATDPDPVTNLPRGFWQSGQMLKFTATGTTITDASGSLTTAYPAGCLTTCTPTQLAAFDVNTWVQDMNSQFPTYNATVTCAPAPVQIDCTIQVTWTEKQLAINATAAVGSATQITQQSYSIYVKP